MSDRPNLNYFTNSAFLSFDSAKGVLTNRSGTRMLGVSEDFLRGFVVACEYEAGEATRTILRSCGKFYGRRLAMRCELELGQYAGTPLRDRPMAHFEALVADLWSGLGMGQLSLDFSQGRYGLIPVTLLHSPMQDIGPKGHVADDLLCGILEGFFASFGGDELACTQTGDARLGSKEGTTFILAFPETTKRVVELLATKISHSQIVAKLTG